MRYFRLAIMAIPVVVLSACGGGTPPAAPASSAPAAAAPAADATPQPAATAPAASGDLTPLFGDWAVDLAQCGKQALKISDKRFDGPGGGCDITGFSDGGDGSYTAALNCGTGDSAAKESVVMRPIFAPTGEGIDITYVDHDNQKSEVLRCEAPAAAK